MNFNHSMNRTFQLALIRELCLVSGVRLFQVETVPQQTLDVFQGYLASLVSEATYTVCLNTALREIMPSV